MTDKRRPPNLSEQVAVLETQAFCSCRRCRVAMARLLRMAHPNARPRRLIGKAIEYHHAEERALDGADHPDNYLALTKECHAIETNGPKGSRSKITKARKLERAREALRTAEERTAAAKTGERYVVRFGETPRNQFKRQWPKGRKIPNRSRKA